MEVEIVLPLVIGISLLSLGVAFLLARQVLAADTGKPEMREISDAIREGAEAFLSRQYRTIGGLSLVAAAAIFAFYYLNREVRNIAEMGGGTFWKVTISFVAGALCSAIAGYIGMFVSIRANIRTAAAAMSLLGVGGLCYLFDGMHDYRHVPLQIVGFGFGASFVALFAQLGGGIYTKAADVGADLVGKVEANIPEDDPRNPAVIADLVGDNVGDCAGRGADLFESTAAENIGAMILAATLYQVNSAKLGPNVLGVMLFPLVARAFGIIASIFGVMVVKTDGKEDPMHALNRGFYVTAILAAAGFAGASVWLLQEYWMNFFLCGLVGIATSLAFVFITQYYTEYRFRPVQEIAEASISGPATNIIQGIAVGLECVWMPVLVISAAILGSYKLGEASGLTSAGLFGTAVAPMGMLGTAGY